MDWLLEEIGTCGRDDKVRLRVTMGTWLVVINMDVDFLVMNALNNMYNVIIGRTSLNKAQMIVSTLHLLMKFPTPKEIG